MKIWCQMPVKHPREDRRFKNLFDFWESHFNLVKRKDTEILIRDVPTLYFKQELQQYSGFRLFGDVEVLKSLLAAEKEDVDGVIITCFLEPAFREARQLLEIPVVGLAESSMHLASMMGAKFAIIASNVNFIPVIEEEIIRYGMESRVIKRNPVRALTISAEEEILEDAVREHPIIVENFKEIAAECVEDGAEVLIMGCALVSPVLIHAGLVELNGAAIIDPLHAALKLSEILIDLHSAKMPFVSRKLLYSSVSRQDITEVLKSQAGRTIDK
jgi:allantoin racemase